MTKTNNKHPLLQSLEIRRKNVADYLIQQAIGFNTETNRRIEIERAEIARIKRQLKSIGISVKDEPIDEDESNIDDSDKGLEKKDEDRQIPKKFPKPQKSYEAGFQPGWIILIIVVSAGLALVLSLLISDIYILIVSFIFILLLLGIILPFLALQNRTLSQEKWLKSYIATLKQIPLLGNVIKSFEKK
jgi:hypothetical protein